MLMPSVTPTRVFLLVAAVLGFATIASSVSPRPLNVHTGYAPEQPIAFSHRLHAGELGTDCLYCHYGARTSRHAGVPPTSVCMNCHASVSAGLDAVLEERELAVQQEREPLRLVSQEIRKIYESLGLDENLEATGAEPRPIPWVRVHNLPDFVAFDHSVHVGRGLACATCHGSVQSMERVRQESDLSMGWCVNCHREQGIDAQAVVTPEHARLNPADHVSTDCVVCHY